MQRICILPWGDAIEDYLDAIDVSLEQFRDEMTGGWLFGWVEALRSSGIETTIICVSKAVSRPVHWRHRPTGAELIVLPLPRRCRLLRRALAGPYAWSVGEARRREGRLSTALATISRELASYCAMPIRHLRRELRRTRCDAILCQEYEYERFDLLVALGRLLRIPVFGIFQGGSQPRTALERWIRPRSVRACSGLVIGSIPESRRVQQTYDLPTERIAQVVNPLDVSDWHSEERTTRRGELGASNGTLVVAWHGRIDMHRKGLDTLIAAWNQLSEHDALPQRKLLLIGSGQDDAILRGWLDELARSDIVWMDRYVLDKRWIAGWLAAADLYALPSRHEGLPVALIEAMATGLPVVAADAPGVAEILPDGERSGGVVVPPGDYEALAEALAGLLADGRRRARLAAHARERAQEGFSTGAVGERLRDFLTRQS
jgi:glycosyltransferase involved in cell wall biosynthesis